MARVQGSPSAITAVAAGEADLTFRQPAGFTTPATRQRLRVTVTGQPTDGPKVSVRVSFTGRGTITGSVACSSSPCIQLVSPASNITLIATAAPGYRFLNWTMPVCSDLTYTFSANSNSDVTAVFVPATAPPADAALHFRVTGPCRLVDTRNPNGALGGPAIPARGTRNFPIRSACGLPADSRAYSLNITVVPRGSLGYLTVWPGGQTQPVVSTLNSVDGRLKANAAIVPAGADGSINVYATDTTDVIIDVNGVFIPRSQGVGEVFYPVTACRVLDTRETGLIVQPGTARYIPAAYPCPTWSGRPPLMVPSATAFVYNVTVVPKGPLGYLTLWPLWQNVRPEISTLNAPTGTIVANMAIVGTADGVSAGISAFATDTTDLILDLVGFFAPPAVDQGGLAFYSVAPCRAVDTRGAEGSLGGPALRAGVARAFPVQTGPCGLPATAQAYAVSATVVPPQPLGYLTLFPGGASTRPLASTLNAIDGAITSNAAIVLAGDGGGVSAFATERTHFILDINGYFAP